MTVSNTPDKIFYTTNGVTTAFSFDFAYFNATDINLKIDNVLINPLDYTLTPAPSGPGGTITVTPAPAATTASNLLIYRSVPYDQTDIVPTENSIPSGLLESAFDKLTILTQQIQETLTRCIVQDIASSLSLNLTLPTPVANMALKWAPDGLSLVNSTVDPDAQVSAATAQAVIATAQAATAASQASTATAQAATATTQAATATTQASNAAASAAAAAVSAANAAAAFNSAPTGLTTKGDLLSFSTVNVRIPVGTNAQVLTADSAQAAGVKWAESATYIFTKSFISSGQAIASAGAISLAHSLGVAPVLVQCAVQCTSAEAGYSIGDIVPVSYEDRSADGGLALEISGTTNITGRYGAETNPFSIAHKTSGVRTNLTNAKWLLIIKAWA